MLMKEGFKLAAKNLASTVGERLGSGPAAREGPGNSTTRHCETQAGFAAMGVAAVSRGRSVEVDKDMRHRGRI